MNEERHKIKLGDKSHGNTGLLSYYVKPSGKFWKRVFNKRVRKRKIYNNVYRRGNWMEWC